MGGNAFATNRQPVLALLACLGAALSYGLAGTFGRRFRRMGISPVVGTFGQTVTTSLMMLPLVAIVDAPWHLATPGAFTLGAVVCMALFSTALAYVIYFHLLSVGGATNASLVTLLIPASAILLGSLILGERLSANHFAGMALIALGLLAIDGRLIVRLRRTFQPQGST